MPSTDKYIKYINSHRNMLKLQEISSFIGMDNSGFSKALNGRNMPNGKPYLIPKRCLPLLQDYFTKHQIKIK